jgi:hypothetical protein
MASLLKLIPALLLIGRALGSFVTKWKARKDARREVAGEIAAAEVKVAHEVAEIMAQPRTADDTAQRLRDGKF